MTRIASTPFYADGTVISTWGGWGALGSAVPSSGDSGPALTYPTLAPLLPGAAGSEVRMELITLPASGVFTYFDDTSATLAGAANGAWTASFRVFIAEVDQGVATAFFYVGGAVATMAGSLGSVTGDLSAGLDPPVAVLAGTLGSITGALLARGGFALSARPIGSNKPKEKRTPDEGGTR